MPMRPAAHGISSTGEQPRRATFYRKEPDRICHRLSTIRERRKSTKPDSLKYHDNKELGYLLGRQIARELQADHSPICTVDLLIPVPLHPRKKRQRGYNQSEWIASGIRSIWDIPIDTQSLARTTHTSTQTRKAIYDRWLNVCSIFNVIHPESLKNKHILLIDDVITTGATISACAKALSGIPGIRISILALSVA
jgi:ComF family protein